MFRYIYSQNYFLRMSNNSFGSDIIRAINENETESSEILKRHLKGIRQKVTFRILNEDFADFYLERKDMMFNDFYHILNEFNSGHNEDYYKRIWNESSFSKEYDVITVLLHSREKPCLTKDFAECLIKSFMDCKALANATDIKACLTPIRYDEYVSDQESYEQRLMRGYATEMMDTNSDCFELDIEPGYDMCFSLDSELSSDADKSSIYCMCFVVQTTIPQTVDYQELDSHSYSVRYRHRYQYSLPECPEARKYDMENTFYSHIWTHEE